MAEKAIFLDRDDTLIDDPGYINDPDQVRLLEGVAHALIDLKAMGYKLVVVSNQSGVARGIVTEETLAKIHDRLRQVLAFEGASLDAIYYCPYLADGVVPKYRKDSNLRKPKPGMLLKAASEMSLELTESWMIGDSPRDVTAGKNAGCKTILLDLPTHERATLSAEQTPDYHAVNMKEAVNIIKQHNRTAAKKNIEPEIKQQQITPPPSENIQPEQTQKIEPPKEISEAKSELQQPSQEKQEITEEKENPPSNTSSETIEHLLKSILDQLRSNRREQMFAEFSLLGFISGMMQVMVFFCLLISIIFLIKPEAGTDRVYISLGFATVLQLTALTFYLMREKK